jgi:TolB-like protein/Flp pilus assembly protein TadD
MAGINALIREARRRRVFRTAGVYVVGAWVVLQVAQLALQSFGYPDTLMRLFWAAALLGFPLALIFGWRYDMGGDGIRRTPPPDPQGAEDLSLGGPDYVILSALLLVAVIVSLGIGGQLWRASPVVGQIDPHSVAVLPIEDLSGNPDYSYFSAGMHEALITSLSRIRALRVTSGTSARRIDESLTVPEIAATLGVAFIVDGSVAREADKVRLSLRLVDTKTDSNIWARAYERSFSDILSLQNDLAYTIANAIQVDVTPQEQAAFSTYEKTKSATYDAYLRAIVQMHKETPEAYEKGLGILTLAVENDPTSALAYAGLAYAYGKLGHSPFPVEGAYPRSKVAAERALKLDDTLAEAHLALGMFKLYYEWDWDAAEAALLRAIELNPSLVAAHYHYAWMMELFNEREKALAAGDVTMELDPLDPFYSGWLADQYRAAGKYDESIQLAQQTLALSPNAVVPRLALGLALAQKGEFDRAVAAHEPLKSDPFWSFALGATYGMAGRRDEALQILAQFPKVPPFAAPRVIVHGALGDTADVFEWLVVAEQQKMPWFPWFITWFPQTEYLRDDPRMRALAVKLELDSWRPSRPYPPAGT